MRLSVLASAAALVACAGANSSVGPDAQTDASDAGILFADGPLHHTVDDAGSPSLPSASFDVARELRGVWVSTVPGLDFPSSTMLPAQRQLAELEAIVDKVDALGLNTIYFQSRVASDALYRSHVEPWSRVLTGTQGRDPGYDPLGTLITLAHARGIEVHAWLNPYRGTSRTADVVTAGHITQVLASDALPYNGIKIMDPSSAAVRAWIVRVVLDIAEHYDVDGIHFDDYFYPYPNSSNDPFPDDERYQSYRRQGGTLSKNAWRRDNVNRMVREVSRALAFAHPQVRFGISPFGIYRPNVPMGVVGLDAYNTIACDPLAWLREETVDYLVPQLYWPTASTGQPFGALLMWWAAQASVARPIYAGHAAYRLNANDAWPIVELETQINLTRGGSAALQGGVFFRYQNLLNSEVESLLSRAYQTPVLPPRMPRGEVPAAPVVDVQGSDVRVASSATRALAVLRVQDRQLLQLEQYSGWLMTTLPQGAYAAVAVNRYGWVSAPTLFSVTTPVVP